MKGKKATKRALLSSALSLVLCFSMLLGTTFAWFTDEAKTGVNTIQAGTLDIMLMGDYDGDGKYTDDLEGQSLKFVKADTGASDDVLWEPGATYYTQGFQIKNAGNLWLKFEIVINGVSDGNAKLLEAINFVISPDKEGKNGISLDNNGKMYELAPDATFNNATYYLVGHMDEDAGNEYQDLKIEGVGITVFATQKDAESDSFDNQYDADAAYGTLVTTNEELLAAIQDPSVLAIRVDGDLTYDWGSDSYANSKALLMSGKTFFGADENASITFAGYGSANPITNVTLKNITVKDVTVGDDESSWEHGYLEFVSLIAENVVFADSIMLDGNSVLTNCSMNNTTPSWYGVWVNSGNATITDSTFTGTRAIKIHEYYGSEVASVDVDNCIFELTEKPGVAIGTVNADTSVSITNSVFDCAESDTTCPSYEHKVYESDTDVAKFDFTVKNNTTDKNIEFVANDTALNAAISGGADVVVLGSGNYIIPDSAQGKTLTITGNGETVVATQDDGSYEGCDYSLDGATVTFNNITINTDSSTYTGYARCKGTYNNCTINGTYTLYGDSVFNNCTFNVTGDVYNIWTWGAPTATFNNCTFNSDGKAVLLYGTVNTKLTVDGCTFNDNGGLTDKKAAIEIGNDYGKSYELIVNNTTVNGYEINDKGINTGTTLWGNKNSMGTDKLNVVVDGVDVY